MQFIRAIVLLFVFIASCRNDDPATKSLSQVSGDFRTAHVKEKHLLFETSISKNFLKKYISERHQKNIRDYVKENAAYVQNVALEISVMSECFHIDPFVFTALIERESSFRRNAVSPRQAVGLSQFTTIGIREVHDQLGLRGERHARSKTIQYYKSQINDCANQKLQKDFSWIWKNKKTEPEMKKLILKDTSLALLFGAILFKTKIAVMQATQSQNLDPFELHRFTVEAYNGDPDISHRQHHASTIMSLAEKLFELQKEEKADEV